MSPEEMMRQELFSWDMAVPDVYRNRYPEQLEQFVMSMAGAYQAWTQLDKTIQESEQRAHISALIYSSLNLHVMSTKLLLWGFLIPSGNTMRQVLETISMSLLASKPDLGFLERYAANQYSTSLAVRDVIRNADKLNLVRGALETLRQGRDFYDKFSHPTLLTIATYIEFGGGKTYFGASFDPAKQDAYGKEINTRVQVAGLLENMIQGIRYNLDG